MTLPRSTVASFTSRSAVLFLAAALPPFLVLLLALPSLFRSGNPQFPCPLYPNAMVGMGAPLYPTCSLAYGTRIDGIESQHGTTLVQSANDVRSVIGASPPGFITLTVTPNTQSKVVVRSFLVSPIESSARLIAAVVLCGVLLSIVLLTAVRARVRAAAPFALIYGSVGALVAAAVAGWMEAAVYPIAALARAALPAAISDLAMVFPRRRGIAARVPAIRVIPYISFGLLWMAELDATYRSSHSTTFLVQQVLSAGSAVATALLCLSCLLAIRESSSRIERSQARVFLQGMAALGAVTGVLWLVDDPGGIWSAATVGAALSPLPLGYAISRYHLFDLDVAVRRAAGRIVYLLTASMIVFTPLLLMRGVLDLPDMLQPAPILFALVFSVVWPLDLVWSWLSSSIETAFRPRGVEWDRLSSNPATAGIAHLRDPQEIAVAASQMLRAGFPEAHNAIFWKQGAGFSLANATGPDACTDSKLAALAWQLFPQGPTDLNRVELGEAGELLFRAGVESSCPIASQDGVAGWILLSPARRGMFVSSGHLSFLASIAAQAATAFEASRLTEELIVAEQFAARGRVHAELAHEIGKPLGTLEVMARKLSKMSLDGRYRSTARSIERLAAQIREIVRGVLENAPAPSEAAPVQLGDIVERALREIADIKGQGHVVVHPLPALCGLPVASHRLVRVLINVLDNAIEASDEDGNVELRASVTDSHLVLEVEDFGRGMTATETQQAMKAFVSFRKGGTGLGLAISREIVEGLGGQIKIESRAERGTTVWISIPRVDAG